MILYITLYSMKSRSHMFCKLITLYEACCADRDITRTCCCYFLVYVYWYNSQKGVKHCVMGQMTRMWLCCCWDCQKCRLESHMRCVQIWKKEKKLKTLWPRLLVVPSRQYTEDSCVLCTVICIIIPVALWESLRM